MANLEFQFNQTQLSSLINNTPAQNNLLFSIFSFRHPGKDAELYVAAQSCDPASDVPDTTIVSPNPNPPVACPVPPGWTAADAPAIAHSGLANCPKFIISAAAKQLLLANQFPPAGDKLLSVILEGSTPSSDLVIKASFKIKNATGTPVSSVDAEVK